ncbi:MAG: chemotaxis protein CheW [Candidatus Eisenbacteria bacterium]|uniref:Chemotaxis protein CheW n=1 Tax=Eiseniibacteriota bacterium TaxID=2212470 RepID=A0A948W626_UNCEI|nr:chemotaxis protein CheW [Candidatus Eisenbacteria bacterium]MBU1951144.1 chemotaxis protein CheW [Candidatus Eisenbacteria bacterium]MBU2690191.1 chemotaxis protein CheW [Candidatus Eisenbacteria bacterium]
MDRDGKIEEKSIPEAAGIKNLWGKYLTFYLDNEEYGIEILKVQEIIGKIETTRVPQTPRYIKGVANLRGRIIPVIDLRLMFDLGEVRQSAETCTIVVQASGIVAGIIVDRVSEVLNIPAENTEQTPAFGAGVNTDYIRGIGKSGSGVILFLDIDRICDITEALETLKDAS